MMRLCKLFICVGTLIFLLTLTDASRYERCSVGGKLKELNLGELENNSPKRNELIRTKLYFDASGSYIKISNSSNQIVFGEILSKNIIPSNFYSQILDNWHGNKIFKVFKSQSDYASQINQCSTKEIVPAFYEKTFVEFEMILESKF